MSGLSESMWGVRLAEFEYEAMDHTGLEKRGVTEAHTEAEATTDLRSRGWFVTNIRKAGTAGSSDEGLRASHGSIAEPAPIARVVPASDEANHLLQLTVRLLQSIDSQDWNTYASLCDEKLTAFEPEARGQLVEGMKFHRIYFELNSSSKRHSTMCSPQVRVIGDAAIVTYGRLMQISDSAGPRTAVFEETRIWCRGDGSWKNVHFHRSGPA